MMRDYDVVFSIINPDGEAETQMLIGVPTLREARSRALAAKADYPDAVAVHVEVISSEMICDSCNGSGKLADGTKPITFDHVEWIPCPYCNGSGNESGRPEKTYLSQTL